MFFNTMENNNTNKVISKKVHIDSYMEKPFALLSRTEEANVILNCCTNDNRFDVYKTDRYKTRLMSIPMSKIHKHTTKTYSDNLHELQFKVHDIFYKISVFI